MKKMVSLVLMLCMLMGIVIPSYASSSNVKKNASYLKSESLSKEYEEAIKVIELNYLKRDKSGNFSIDSNAYKVIDKEIVDNLIAATQATNQLIKSGDIVVQGNKLKANSALETKMMRAASGGVTKVTMEWYGLNYYYNAYDCNVKAAQFAQATSIFGGGGVATGFIPGIGPFIAGIAGAEVAMFGFISGKLWEGNAKGCGAYVMVARYVDPVNKGVYYQPFGARLQ